MHGSVLKGLKDFVIARHGEDGWDAVREAAGVPGRIYVPVAEYPDEEVMDLVAAGVEVTDVPTDELLGAFGEFLVGPLVETYGVHVDGEWDGLELVANVEEHIHEALRKKRTSDIRPPAIGARREGEDRVVVHYGSDRELCELAKGLVRGVGDYYDERYEVDERQCMKDGAQRCEIVVTRRSRGVSV